MTGNDAEPVAVPAAMGQRRRAWLYGGVALAATAVGAGIAWRERGRTAPMDAATETLWKLVLQAPDQSSLAMQAFTGRPLLLNFWATWCPPCVEEMPLLDGFYRANSAKGWQVVGIAADQRTAVQSFLARSPVRYPVALAGMDGIALSRSLGNEGGGLPFTVVFDATGRAAHRKIGRVTAEELQLWSHIAG